MSTPAIPRHAAGSSQGGQFAAYSRAPQAGHLDPGSDEWYDADHEMALKAVFDDDFMDDLQEGVRMAAAGMPTDPGDLLSETYLAVRARVDGAYRNRRPLRLAGENRPSYLASIARATGMTVDTGLDSGADIGAWKEFGRRRVIAEASEGRPLSVAERDALAEEVRESFPPRRRPGPKFFKVAAERGVTYVQDTGAGQCGARGTGKFAYEEQAPEAAVAAESGGWSDGLRASPVMKAMITVQKSGTAKRGAAERMVYTLAAVEYGAPLPVEGGVSEKVWYSRHKQVLADAGGVENVIADYQAGRCSKKAEEALFAPVTPPGKTLTASEKQATCRALTHFPGKAGKTYTALVNTVLQHEADAQRAIAAERA